jgi:ADP-ribose pyrophosphatase YjhB (NUDIX family)
MWDFWMPQADLLLDLARFVERVAATARTGLAFKPGGYDSERYHELLSEAASISALLEGVEPQQAVELASRWRAQVISGYEGYVTAAVGVGVIAFNNRDQLLMIQRPTGRWWYPTGFCDVGLSPAENAAKEAREETGLIVTPLRLIGILDSRKQGSLARHIYSLLFYCRLDGGTLAPSPLEAIDARFFSLDALPEPLHGVSRVWVELARQFHFENRTDPYFDPL